MKRFLLAFILIMILSISACTVKDTVAELNFIEHKTEEITNITQIELPNKLNLQCKSYSFDYNVDGIIVKGYISIPNDCSASNPYKCLIYNRGGNCNFGFLSDEDTAKICAETKRIVIASQYRKDDEFGGEDLNDVIKLIDFCENFDFTDMKDFAVAGISRGGMMSYMAARIDNRIKRVISISGVSNLTQAYNDRDDMKKILNNFIGGSPEELPEEYENRSAICWYDEINIPTLIIHSTYDQQVSYSQAKEMYDALTSIGTDVTFKTYNDSTHGLHKNDVKIIAKWLE